MKLQFFVAVTWFIHCMPSKIYSTYPITAEKISLETGYRKMVQPPVLESCEPETLQDVDNSFYSKKLVSSSEKFFSVRKNHGYITKKV